MTGLVSFLPNQLKTEKPFTRDSKPEKQKEWVWLANWVPMKNCKSLKVNKVKNNKTLMLMRNTLVKEGSLPLKRDKLLLDTEMPSKLLITSSITPITSETSLTNIKVSSLNQDSTTLPLQLSLILKVYNFLMELLSLLKKIFQNLWNAWETLNNHKTCTQSSGKIINCLNLEILTLMSTFIT